MQTLAHLIDSTMHLVNLTPHSITIKTPTGLVTLPATGTVARVTEKRIAYKTIVIQGHEIQITRVIRGKAENLPEPSGLTFYIVSSIVANACKDRSDLLTPGQLCRDDSGNVIGCLGLDIQA